MVVIKQALEKIKQIRVSKLTIGLTVLLAIQLVMSGSIVPVACLLGGVFPFMLVVGSWPQAGDGADGFTDALSTLVMALIICVIFLGASYALSWIGTACNPLYSDPQEHLGALYMLGVSASVTFLAAVMPVGGGLSLAQRMGLGIVLINADLVVLMVGAQLLAKIDGIAVVLAAAGFAALIFTLSAATLWMGKKGILTDKR